jgi:uncharacterized membrane protein YsdA (DUF1294 family)
MLQTIALILLLAINLICLITFGIDKFNSKRRGPRTPEKRLLALGFFGPFGALAGMLLFRHKTRKIKFLIIPIFALLQAIILFCYVLPMLK